MLICVFEKTTVAVVNPQRLNGVLTSHFNMNLYLEVIFQEISPLSSIRRAALQISRRALFAHSFILLKPKERDTIILLTGKSKKL